MREVRRNRSGRPGELMDEGRGAQKLGKEVNGLFAPEDGGSSSTE